MNFEASYLGPHYLPISLLWDIRHKWNYTLFFVVVVVAFEVLCGTRGWRNLNIETEKSEQFEAFKGLQHIWPCITFVLRSMSEATILFVWPQLYIQIKSIVSLRFRQKNPNPRVKG